MASDLDKRIQQRAYEIWESEGRPEGRQHEHWQQARGEFSEARSEAGAGKGGRKAKEAAGSGSETSSATKGTKPKASKQGGVGQEGSAKAKPAGKTAAAKPKATSAGRKAGKS